MASKNTQSTSTSELSVEPTAVQLASLEIDIELRELWVELNQMRGQWNDDQIAVAANLMRCAFQRGRVVGRGEGETTGRRKGFDEGYEAALIENQPAA